MEDSQEDHDDQRQQKSAEEVAILVANPPVTVKIAGPKPASSSAAGRPRNDETHDNESHPHRQSGGEMFFSSSSTSTFSCKKFMVKRLPILKWLPVYKPKTDLLPDAISGFTVCLTAIPQSMAYANVAGLTPEYGLYSSFISCFVYLFLGSCRQMTIGPTALMELLVFETCGQNFPSCVVLVGFWVGCIQFLMGLLRLGAVVSLISDPVTIGFVAGASLTICSSQIRSFLGLSGPKGDGFIGAVKEAIKNISTAKLGDSLLGLGCVIVLVLFKNLKDYIKPDTTTNYGRHLAKFLWFLSLGRNAGVVLASSILAASLPSPPFALTGSVKSGFPPVAPPVFELPNYFSPIPANSTVPTLTFWETWIELNTAPLMIALISILQNVAIAKAFGSGQSIDATQEMIALGVSHIVASFFSAMPTAGSFTRSAVNEASGVKSPVGGVFTGLLIILALSFLTRWFAYIPKASLAAVILCAVLPMIEYETILPMWKISKLDVLTALVTFLVSLIFGMEYGIIVGVAASLAVYLIRPVRPRIGWSIMNAAAAAGDRESTANNDKDGDQVEMISSSREKLTEQQVPSNKRYHLIKPDQGFQFPSVDALRTFINKVALKHPEVKVICLDCENMIAMDYTSASALCSLVKALRKTGKELVLLKCQKDWVEMMAVVGLKKVECFERQRDVEMWII